MRQHLTVDPRGNWELYNPEPLPVGAQALGTIRRKPCFTGALLLLPSGQYVQANAGVIRTLNQGDVRAALAAA